MESGDTFWRDLALLDWQVELGADEAISETPIDRYALEPQAPKPAAAAPQKTAPPPVVAAAEVDPVAEAQLAATEASDLPSLAAAMQAFEHCEIKKGARKFVFSDGLPGARVMIIGEAPGRDEDQIGRPFVGQAGQLLDKMLDAIEMDRASEDPAKAVYIANVLPWRPPANRTPEKEEIAMMLPFLARHIALAAPDVIVLMGNTPCQALLGRAGITRLRGQWTEVLGRPALPMFHPAYLLRQPLAKREAWADLLELRAKLKDLQ